MKILVTGGAGFIGSAVVRTLIDSTTHDVVNLDKLTYAGNLDSLPGVSESQRYTHKGVDICHYEALPKYLRSISLPVSCILRLKAMSIALLMVRLALLIPIYRGPLIF